MGRAGPSPAKACSRLLGSEIFLLLLSLESPPPGKCTRYNMVKFRKLIMRLPAGLAFSLIPTAITRQCSHPRAPMGNEARMCACV